MTMRWLWDWETFGMCKGALLMLLALHAPNWIAWCAEFLAIAVGGVLGERFLPPFPVARGRRHG